MARRLRSHGRKLLPAALVVAAGATAALSGCNDVPPNAVAKIGDTTIERKTFDHWLTAAARGQQPPGGAAQVAVPDAPEFTKCIATKQKAVPARGRRPSTSQLKQQCKQEFDGLKQQVMQFLISAEWIQQEADNRDIKATDAEVKRQFEDQKKQSFPTDKAYQDFLKSSGQTEDDLFFRVKLDVLSNEVRQKVVESAGKISDEDIQGYYDKNKARFAQPERRDLQVVLTKTEARAKDAREAIESGQSFPRVVKRFSIDESSKSQDGKLPGVSKGQQEKALDDAVFAASKNALQGPVKTQFGYYVFRVTNVVAAKQQSLDQSKDAIRQLLRSEREQKVLDDFIKEFREKYKEETKCAKGFETEDCSNAPKTGTETGPASGGAPQGAQPGGAPQGAAPGGVPQQGGAPPGAAPQGAPPQGAPQQGAPPQGAPPQGSPQQGAPPPGG